MLPDGVLVFSPQSVVRLEADAPGHTFRAAGAGLEGEVEIRGGVVVRAEAKFLLSSLDAGDALGNRELKRFLQSDQHPLVRGVLVAPMTLAEDPPGNGQVELTFANGKKGTLDVRVQGPVEAPLLVFAASFTALGYKPPSLLLLKVKDPFRLQVAPRWR